MLTIVLSDGRTRDLTPEEVERLGGRAAAIFRAQERGWTLLEQGAPLVATGQPVGTAGPPESIARPVTTKIEGSKDVSPAESSGVAARHRARELMEDYRGSRAVPEALAPVGEQVAAAGRVARDVVAAPTADVLPDTATQHPRTFVPDGSSGPTPIARQALDRTAAAVRGLNELNPLHAATLPPYIREAADRALAETPQAAGVAQAGGRAVASGALGAVGGAVSGRLAQTLPGRLSTALGTQAAVGAGEEAVQMLPEIRARLDAGRGLPEAVGETIRETYDPTTASGALAIAGAVGGPMLGAMGHFRPSHITQYQPGVNPIRTTGFADPTTKQFQAAARLGPTDPLRVPGVHGIDDAIQGRGRYEGMDELLFDIMHEGGPGNVAQYHASLPPRSRDIPEQLSPFTRGDTLRRVTQTTGPVHNQLLERRRAALAGPEAAAQAARQRGRDVYREGVEARGRLSAAQDELEGRLLEARGAELEARQLPRASVGDVASLEHQASGLRRALPEEGSPWQQDLILSTNEFGRLPRPLDARRSLGSIADLAREQARAQGPRGPAPEYVRNVYQAQGLERPASLEEAWQQPDRRHQPPEVTPAMIHIARGETPSVETGIPRERTVADMLRAQQRQARFERADTVPFPVQELPPPHELLRTEEIRPVEFRRQTPSGNFVVRQPQRGEIVERGNVYGDSDPLGPIPRSEAPMYEELSPRPPGGSPTAERAGLFPRSVMQYSRDVEQLSDERRRLLSASDRMQEALRNRDSLLEAAAQHRSAAQDIGTRMPELEGAVDAAKQNRRATRQQIADTHVRTPLGLRTPQRAFDMYSRQGYLRNASSDPAVQSALGSSRADLMRQLERLNPAIGTENRRMAVNRRLHENVAAAQSEGPVRTLMMADRGPMAYVPSPSRFATWAMGPVSDATMRAGQRLGIIDPNYRVDSRPLSGFRGSLNAAQELTRDNRPVSGMPAMMPETIQMMEAYEQGMTPEELQ